MTNFKYFYLIIILFVFSSCSKYNLFQADSDTILYSGRIDYKNIKEPVLIGSASYVEMRFKGDSCSVLLKKLNPEGEYNYVSLELDGEYIGRLKLDKELMLAYPIIAKTKSEYHDLRIYKATEAQNNNIAFGGIYSLGLDKPKELQKRKMEFIGNSITCGMGIDWKEIPCNTNVWYDQHNAYYAYGPQSAMAMDAQFMLSSVSGIGIYRNWNSLSPVMPDVYENLYLDTNDSIKYNFSEYEPDLVSICLGTNDFSNGDGIKERLPFDSAQYVSNYINFVKTVFLHYPETQLCLLTSPMINGENAKLFESCLMSVKDYFKKAEPDKKDIALYFFEGLVPHGCGSHPDREDHKEMANRLIPFYKNVMGW